MLSWIHALGFGGVALAATLAQAADWPWRDTGPSNAAGAALIVPASTTSGAMNAIFACEAADQSRLSLVLDTSGKALLGDPATGEQAPGSYQYQNAALSLSVPSLQFQETTRQIEATQDLLLTFQLSNVFCWLLAHEVGEAVQGYVICPKIGYVPSVGWQVNAFQFHSDHSVKWRRWDEYTAIADTTYTESHGTYLVDGEVISMAFGGREKERYLSGRMGPGGTLTIAELEPESGACQPE